MPNEMLGKKLGKKIERIENITEYVQIQPVKKRSETVVEQMFRYSHRKHVET